MSGSEAYLRALEALIREQEEYLQKLRRRKVEFLKQVRREGAAA